MARSVAAGSIIAESVGITLGVLRIVGFGSVMQGMNANGR